MKPKRPILYLRRKFDNNHGESMVVEKQPDGSVAFKNVYTGKYISVTDDESLLKAEGSRADLWELFDIYPYGHFDGGFVLRSRKNGKFVTVDESSGNRLAAICDGTPRSREILSFLNHRWRAWPDAFDVESPQFLRNGCLIRTRTLTSRFRICGATITP